MNAARKTVLLVGLLLGLWLLMSLMTHFWLVPQKMPHDYDLFPSWYGIRASLLDGENPYSDEVSREISIQMGYPQPLERIYHRFYYPATVIWTLLPLWVFPFSLTIVIWCGLQLTLLLILPLLVFWLLQWRISPLLLAAVCVFSAIPWRHSANSYVLGQFTIFTLGCFVVAWAAVVTGHPRFAAVALVGSMIRAEGILVTVWILFDLLLTRHHQILKYWAGIMVVMLVLSLVSTGFWLSDFLQVLIGYREEQPEIAFPPEILGNRVLIIGATAAIVIWGLWMLAQMRSLPDRFRLPWSLSVVMLGALLVLPQTRDYTLVYALLPIWVILWAGHDQRWMIPLMLLILISPWLYAAAKANLGHDNPIEQFTSPLLLAGLLTYQWRRWNKSVGAGLLTRPGESSSLQFPI